MFFLVRLQVPEHFISGIVETLMIKPNREVAGKLVCGALKRDFDRTKSCSSRVSFRVGQSCHSRYHLTGTDQFSNDTFVGKIEIGKTEINYFNLSSNSMSMN